MSKDDFRGWGWMVAKIPGGDYCFLADLRLKDDRVLPSILKVRFMTQIIVTDLGVTYGLWGPEKLGMIEDPLVLQTDKFAAFAPASAKMIDDMEKAWDLKKIQEPKKDLVFPGRGM